MPITNAVWGTPLRKIATSVITAIVGVTGAIVGVDKAAPVVEPWLLASRAHVREHRAQIEKQFTDQIRTSENAVVPILRDIQLDWANGKREATENDIAKWKNELAKPDSNKELVEKSLKQLLDTLDAQNKQIEAIKRAKAQ